MGHDGLDAEHIVSAVAGPSPVSLIEIARRPHSASNLATSTAIYRYAVLSSDSVTSILTVRERLMEVSGRCSRPSCRMSRIANANWYAESLRDRSAILV